MKMFYCKITNKMFTTYLRQFALVWLFFDLSTIHCQLFSMDQSKILRIYGDILPKKNPSYDNTSIVPTTERLHVKHFSNSKINNYLSNIHKNQWFEQTRVQSEAIPKTISDVNSLFNQNQNSEWVPNENNFQSNWDGNHQNSENNFRNSERPFRNQDSGWSLSNEGQNDDGFFSSTTETPEIHVNHRKKNKKRQDSSYYNVDVDYAASNKEITDWSTPANNFVTPPKETRQQYSTIYKQHKTKSNEGKDVRNIYDDWSTPRSMSAYSEWLTTPQPYTTPDTSQNWETASNNNWTPSNYDTRWNAGKTTKKPAAVPLSTSGPDLEEFITRQENRIKKYSSLYTGINSYGVPSQDVYSKPRDYRQTPISTNNYNPTILKDQFDIPPNIQSYDPYSEYQDVSSSTSYYPYSPSDNFIPSTTENPYFDNKFQSKSKPPRNVPSHTTVKFNNNYANNNYDQGNRQGFGEPETVIENKYQTTLKKHFDNTINLYESQSKRTKFNPQQNGGAKYNVELPSSNIKFEVPASDPSPKIVIQNYHFTTDHPQNGYSEVYNQQNVPTTQQPHFHVDSVSQYSQDDLQLPANYDYTPKRGHDVTFTTESSVPIVEIGGFSKSPPGPNFYEGNYTLNPPPVTYEIPHLKKIGKPNIS